MSLSPAHNLMLLMWMDEAELPPGTAVNYYRILCGEEAEPTPWADENAALYVQSQSSAAVVASLLSSASRMLEAAQ